MCNNYTVVELIIFFLFTVTGKSLIFCLLSSIIYIFSVYGFVKTNRFFVHFKAKLTYLSYLSCYPLKCLLIMLNSSNISITDLTRLWSILPEDHLGETLTRTIPQ